MTERYDERPWDQDAPELRRDDPDLEEARENVFEGWPSAALSAPPEHADDEDEEEKEEEEEEEEEELDELDESGEPHAAEPFAAETEVAAPELEFDREPADEPVAGLTAPAREQETPSVEHAPGELTVPPGYSVLEGEPDGSRRAVGVVVARFNGDVTTRLLESALDELDLAGVSREAITVMPVPGAFELPLAAMALAKTRRFAAIVALGCVIRGDTPHFDYIASEAASGLQLAAIETGVPVSFGVLTLDRIEQAEHRIAKGAESVRTALEMADVFAKLRAAAAG